MIRNGFSDTIQFLGQKNYHSDYRCYFFTFSTYSLDIIWSLATAFQLIHKLQLIQKYILWQRVNVYKSEKKFQQLFFRHPTHFIFFPIAFQFLYKYLLIFCLQCSSQEKVENCCLFARFAHISATSVVCSLMIATTVLTVFQSSKCKVYFWLLMWSVF